MSAASIQILDELIATFSRKHPGAIDCKSAWKCPSIGRIGFVLNLWKEFKIAETDDIKTKSDFIFILNYFLKPFDLRDIMGDFLHVRDKHSNEKDVMYLNNGLTIPLCCDEHCITESKYYHQISNVELEENEVINHMAMLHLYFAHKNGSAYLNEMQSQSIINIKPWAQCNDEKENDERFKLILKSQSIHTLELLFDNLTRNVKYKEIQTLYDILLQIYGPKIDSVHVDIPLNILQERSPKPQLMIFKGILLPNEPHHTQKVLCDEYCNSHWQCLSMKRVAYIMERYNQMKHGTAINGNDDADDDSDFDVDDVMEDDNPEEEDIHRETIEQILLYPGYSITGFVNDYNLIKANHLSKNIKAWEWIKDELKSCKHGDTHCYIVQRHSRDREKYDDKAMDRRQLYDNKCDSKDVVPLQILDEVHDYLMHWDYKSNLFPHINDPVKMDEEEMKKPSIKDTKSKPKPKPFISAGKRESRYNTTFLPDDSFVFGELFYHWEFYKDRDTYIAPNKYKHKNLKEEMLYNELCTIGLHLWNDALTKSIIHKYSIKGRVLLATDRGAYNSNRAVPKNLSIPITHLLVILIYTNYNTPQYTFKKEGMRNVSDKHFEISHFYKLFSETILFYGKGMTETDVLYHGISRDDLYFTSFHPQFNVPISTTSSMAQAKKFFTDKGMLLVLKSDKSIADRYFDCWCSDHSKEKECLFAQAHHVFIVDIKFKTNTGLSRSNAKYIKSMTLFQDILESKYFTYSMPDFKRYEANVIQLIEAVNTDTAAPSVNPYIIKSFARSFRNFETKKKIQIIQSEYNKLDDITKTMMQKCFNINKDAFVTEFKWEISKERIKVELVDEQQKCVTQFIASNDEEYDGKFTFCMYIKIYAEGKVSVGIWVKKIKMEKKRVHVEWGYKCHETKYAVSQKKEYFMPDTSDAYRAFIVSELNGVLPSLQALHFTFYLKLLK